MEQKFQREFDHNGKTYKYYSLEALNDPRIHQIPYSIRILLEHSIRSHYDGKNNNNCLYKFWPCYFFCA